MTNIIHANLSFPQNNPSFISWPLLYHIPILQLIPFQPSTTDPLYYIWFVFNSSLKSSIHLIIFPQKNGILQQPNAIWNHSHLYSFHDNQLSHLKTVTLPPLSFSHRYPSLKLNNDGSKQAHHFKYPSLITMLGCLFCTIYGELFAKFTKER